MVEERRATGRRWLLWTALGLVALVSLCTAPVAVGVAVIRGVTDARGSSASSPSSAPAPTPARSPAAGDPTPVVAAWLRDRMAEALAAQGRALLAGDEKGFLAPADPAAIAVLRRQYANLRALGVARWEPTLSTPPARQADGRWRALVEIRHCFGGPECDPGPVTIGTRWTDTPAGVRLAAIEPSLSSGDGPRPWEVDRLVVRAGQRVTVATAPSRRRDLARVLAEADQAALVADRYAVGGPAPARYLVFYAGPAEWKRWYGGGRPSWTAGYAVPVGGRHLDVVINAAAPHRTRLDDLLRHEMTHAASMPGTGYDPATWWLVEGVAELAATGGVPTSQYEGLVDVRRLVRDGNWNGPLEDLAVAADADDWEVSAAYGVGYIAVRHLTDRFGEPDVLTFLEAVVHRGETTDAAAREVFGQPWADLAAQCVAAVRAAAG